MAITMSKLRKINASGGNNAILTHKSIGILGENTRTTVINRIMKTKGITSAAELSEFGKVAGFAGWRAVWACISPKGNDAKEWSDLVFSANPKDYLKAGEKATIGRLASSEANDFKATCSNVFKTNDSKSASPLSRLQSAVRSCLNHEGAGRLTADQITAAVEKEIATNLS